ncbi:MAG: glycosyltransferase [Candidatus Peribacteraceae bacterium]|nr:glycosyltransferase [Candidatus Peribacteraceae bacterium]
MKIALVHELLTMRGGAERVLRILADMFPDAPIFTLLYDEKKLGDWFPRDRVHPSSIQPKPSIFNFQFSIFNSFNHHLYLNRFPAAVEAWDFSAFDLVISSSSAFAHGIIANGKPKHLCYVQSPARYLWDRTHDVVDQAAKGLLGPLKRRYLERAFHTLRIWDSETADRPDMLLAASKTVERRIELYWRRQSDVLYPPIDDGWLEPTIRERANHSMREQMEHPDYFLLVSTLARYKRIDLTIEACNRLKCRLKIVGEGPDRKRLEKLAGPTIEFYGYCTGDHLIDLLSNARATLFPGDEDFGLVPLESMACGTPVIAYRSGGALETIIEHETGEFFDEATPESLQFVLQNFDQNKYSRDACITQAKKFSREKFEAGIRDAIDTLMSDR